MESVITVEIDASIPAWRWPEGHVSAVVEQVRAGESLVAADAANRWPDGARVAVALSFDADHESISLRDGLTSPGRMAQGEYGARVGVPRILDLLEEHHIPATFFVPAMCALLRPDEAPRYVERGHEVGVHGWIHERNSLLDAADERELTWRAVEVLEGQTGVRPVGIRTPSWDFSNSTLDIISELGFRYDSSLMADDDPYELLRAGDRTGIVEIPVEWIRDDIPYLATEMAAASRPFMAPRHVAGIWQDEFDAAYESGGVFQLTMHPHVIGHRSRMVALEGLINHIQSFPDVWFATHADLAAQVAKNLPDANRREQEN